MEHPSPGLADERGDLDQNGASGFGSVDRDVRFIMAHHPHPVVVIQEGAVVAWNAQAEKEFKGRGVGMDARAVAHDPQQADSWLAALQNVLDVGRDSSFSLSGDDRKWMVHIHRTSRGQLLCAWEPPPVIHGQEEPDSVLRKEMSGHRRTQEALAQSRRFARALVESSLDMIMAADPEGRITEYNPAASLRFGYEAEEVIGTDTLRLYAAPEEYERVQRELDRHGSFAGEVRNMTKYGEEFTAFLAASRLYDEEGRYLGAMGVSRDVTQWKRDREALKASEERYRDLFENATDLIQSVDAKGAFQYVNNAWRERLGYSDAELSKLTIWDIIEPSEREHCRAVFARLFKGDHVEPISTTFIGKSGRLVRVVGNSNARYENSIAVATRSIFRDITTQFEAQERVREQDAKLQAIFESSEHMFWTVDRDLTLTSFNNGYAGMVERLYGIRPRVAFPPPAPRSESANEEHRKSWERRYAEAFSGKAQWAEFDTVDVTGARVCNEVFLSPVFNVNGEVDEVFGIGHEITEKREAEDLAREQGARLQAIFDSSANMMIWTLDRDLRITSFNGHFQDSVQEAFGMHCTLGTPFMDEMVGRIAAAPPERFIAKYQNALRGYPQQFEVELVAADGRIIWVENFLNPIVVEGTVNEVSCLAHTITEKKEAQTKLIESLKEKEILLKEVHHRVKNNLQVISSILNLQSDHVDGDERLISLLRDSQARIRSMSYIHESLYQRKNFSSVDIGTYIEGLSRNLMMTHGRDGGGIGLRMESESVELGLDQAIPCGLMINELISNALKHAFPDRRSGEITVSVSRTGNRVNIVIADNGIGMPPGFSLERDANLGLQLVDTLVGQLDGHIERRPNTGTGTRYEITFLIAPPRPIA